MRYVPAAVLAAVFLLCRSAAAEEETKWLDKNNDGKPETRTFFEKGVPVREESDMNNDGKPDAVMYYKRGVKHFREADRNYDGTLDHWYYYKTDGRLLRYESDTNRDGKPDRWTFLEKALDIILQEQDRNFDGKVDRRTLNEHAYDKRAHYYQYRWRWKEMDSDFDGTVDYYRVRGVKNPVPDKKGTPMETAYKTKKPEAKKGSGTGSRGLWNVEEAMSERQEQEERMNRPVGE